MELVTLTEAKAWLNIQGINTTLLYMYVNAAEEVVRDYLEYDPLEQEYTQTYSVELARDYIRVGAKPITEITSITIDDITMNLGLFSFKNDFISVINSDKLFIVGKNNIEVSFTAGYGTTSSGDSLMPNGIKEVVLKIADIKRGEQIAHGQTTISTPDSGTRTFRPKHYGYEDILSDISMYKISRRD